MTPAEYRIPASWITDGRTSPDELARIVEMFFEELDKAFPVHEEDDE